MLDISKDSRSDLPNKSNKSKITGFIFQAVQISHAISKETSKLTDLAMFMQYETID